MIAEDTTAAELLRAFYALGVRASVRYRQGRYVALLRGAQAETHGEGATPAEALERAARAHTERV